MHGTTIKIQMCSLYNMTYVIILSKCIIRDLVDWKHIQLYTTPTQRSAWRWLCN